ncbi:MAG: hypothetical protein KGH84_13555 [Paracoccaceae bacterium]|nr:hypothetical protein [Paracoccaceae bacterium]
MSAPMATAAHLDLSGQSSAVLFAPGTYAEMSFGTISPSVSGVGTVFSGASAGKSSGNMAGGVTALGFAFKKDFGAHWSTALIYDQPFGANVNYPTGTGYFGAGIVARADVNALTGVLKYRFDSNVSLFGGLRYQTFAANIAVPVVASYTGTVSTTSGFGYVAGIAYEKPDIGLRAALTYNSKIKENLPSTESSTALSGVSTTPIYTPQSVNLDLQMGLNKSTLLFGTVRWVNWSDFSINPKVYATLTGGPLLSYSRDVVTYTLGVGHKFTENWSGAVTVGYEAPEGGFSSNLGPSDGMKSVGLAAIYTQGNMKITGGVQYMWLGSTSIGNSTGSVAIANFSGSHAVGVGVKVGYTF